MQSIVRAVFFIFTKLMLLLYIYFVRANPRGNGTAYRRFYFLHFIASPLLFFSSSFLLFAFALCPLPFAPRAEDRGEIDIDVVDGVDVSRCCIFHCCCVPRMTERLSMTIGEHIILDIIICIIYITY